MGANLSFPSLPFPSYSKQWDVTRAIAMLASCMKWRLDNGVEKLAEEGGEFIFAPLVLKKPDFRIPLRSFDKTSL